MFRLKIIFKFTEKYYSLREKQKSCHLIVQYFFLQKKKRFEIDSTGSIRLDSVQLLINRTEESTSSQRSILCFSADASLGTDVYL